MNSEQWVALAVAGANEPRDYLKYVYVDGGVMFGCDGHRLHWCKTDRPEGYYNPDTFQRAQVISSYPNVRQIIPPDTGNMASFRLSDLRRIDVPVRGYILPDGFAISNRCFIAEYVHCAMGDSDTLDLIVPDDPPIWTTPIRGKSFIIMPTRYKK